MFNIGETISCRYTVKESDVASFEGKVVHRVYSTFSISRDAEWTGRQLLLRKIDSDKEGIGTHVHVKHRAPAFVGETVEIVAVVESYHRGFLVCGFKVTVGERLVAEGSTGQKVMRKGEVNKLMNPNN